VWKQLSLYEPDGSQLAGVLLTLSHLNSGECPNDVEHKYLEGWKHDVAPIQNQQSSRIIFRIRPMEINKHIK
jgi:hypothetical protein